MNERNSSNLYVFWLALCVGALLGLLIMAGGCHTVHGIGQDMQDMTEDYVK